MIVATISAEQDVITCPVCRVVTGVAQICRCGRTTGPATEAMLPRLLRAVEIGEAISTVANVEQRWENSPQRGAG